MKDKRYKIQPTETIILKEREEPNNLRTQYHVQNIAQIMKNQIVIKNNIDELIVKNYPKNKLPFIQQQRINLRNCLFCKQNNWREFDKG